MVFVTLTDEQRRALERASRHAVGRVALRAHMVLLSGRGYSVPQIAEIHACGHDVVRNWLHRYEREGVAGLEDEPKSGRPPKDPLAGHLVDAQAGQSPERSGGPAARGKLSDSPRAVECTATLSSVCRTAVKQLRSATARANLSIFRIPVSVAEPPSSGSPTLTSRSPASR